MHTNFLLAHVPVGISATHSFFSAIHAFLIALDI
jgi:hypothetical protein